jgi:hypothetical protein
LGNNHRNYPDYFGSFLDGDRRYQGIYYDSRRFGFCRDSLVVVLVYPIGHLGTPEMIKYSAPVALPTWLAGTQGKTTTIQKPATKPASASFFLHCKSPLLADSGLSSYSLTGTRISWSPNTGGTIAP